MCHLNMSSFNLAITDAEQSIEFDPKYLKGYFRKIQALILRGVSTDLIMAKSMIIECLEKNPEDKDFLKQLKLVENKILEKEKVLDKETEKVEKREDMKSVFDASKISKINNNEKKSESENDNDKKIAEDEIRIRGYKILADGRKTTFFNNEMDEATKALIGDIAPKKMEGDKEESSTIKGSAWNSGGTFESIDHTAWGLSRLAELIDEDVKGGSEEGDTVGSMIMKGARVEGDAQTIGMRGKIKHVCDITVKISWTYTTSDKSNTFEGQLHVNDVTSDLDYEFEIIYPTATPNFTQIFKTDLKNEIKKIEIKIKEILLIFMDEFSLK